MSNDSKTTWSRQELVSSRRIVIKVGSALLFQEDREGVDQEFVRSISSEIARLRSQNKEVILVSSGAIALGAKVLGLEKKPDKMSDRQALAGVGQSLLMAAWRQGFVSHGLEVAQVLLTHDDLGDRKRYLNASHAIESMLKMGVIPIINENDTVAVEEIQLGDNDRLSGQIAVVSGADLLLILSTAEALFDKNPQNNENAQRISEVPQIDASIESYAHDGISKWGRGGMATKVDAARMVTLSGIPVLVAAGREEYVISRLLSGEDMGTAFHPESRKLKGRKHWIAFTLKPSGKLIVDHGAVKALIEGGKSLLPSGIQEVHGSFERGDALEIIGPDKRNIAVGLSSYSSSDLQKIKGHQSKDLFSCLGYEGTAEVIHRNDLVLSIHC